MTRMQRRVEGKAIATDLNMTDRSQLESAHRSCITHFRKTEHAALTRAPVCSSGSITASWKQSASAGDRVCPVPWHSREESFGSRGCRCRSAGSLGTQRQRRCIEDNIGAPQAYDLFFTAPGFIPPSTALPTCHPPHSQWEPRRLSPACRDKPRPLRPSVLRPFQPTGQVQLEWRASPARQAPVA